MKETNCKLTASVFLLSWTVLLGLLSCNNSSSHQELFETVWETIYETYPDTTFNNLDWIATGEKYRLTIDQLTDQDSLVTKLNEMLFQLNVSHTFLGLRSEMVKKASPYMFKPGTPGFDIRILENQVVITSINEKFNPHPLGLRLGTVIHRINSQDVFDIIDSAPQYPPYNDRYKRFLQTEEVMRHLYGEVGSTVQLEYRNEQGETVTTNITCQSRSGELQLSPDIPPIYIERQGRVLKGNIGYLQFNAFQPEYPTDILNQLDSLRSTEALVIDLRGNNGGALEAQRMLASQFFDKPVAGIIIESRNQVDTLIFDGHDGAYSGPIAIMVDEVSVSGAELFSACLQSLGRAVVVGVPTPGAVMGGTLELLPDNLVLVHPTLRIRTTEGLDLEGVGVMPDYLVPFNKEKLVIGVDNQLEVAIKIMQQSLLDADL